MTDNVIRLRLPFDGHYALTQQFGANPVNYAKWGLAGHEGVDWACPAGTPILAMAPGIVAKARTDLGTVQTNPYGFYVKIQHDGFCTWYCHLKELTVVYGQHVEAGEQVGLSDSTGNSTGNHLHVTFRKNDADPNNGYFGDSDPLPYIQATIAQRVDEWWHGIMSGTA